MAPCVRMPGMTSETSLQTPEAIEARIWQELSRASRDKHHEWRTPVLATVNEQLLPSARTVVLRRVDIQSKRLHFYTDRRSPKCAELARQPKAMLLCWSKRLGWQLRMSIEVAIHSDGAEIDRLWEQISQSPAAADYLNASAPGGWIDAESLRSKALTEGKHFFAKLEATVIDIDWLSLDRQGHRRALIASGGWTWRVP